MSRAFTKERDDAPEPVIDSHVAGIPVPVTAAGRASLVAQLGRSVSESERKRLASLVADLVVSEPPADRGVAAFGAAVEIEAETFGRRRFTIVGAQEADVAAGRISADSPLGSALIGARVGDVVTWRRPIGHLAVRVLAIDYDRAPVGGG